MPAQSGKWKAHSARSHTSCQEDSTTATPRSRPNRSIQACNYSRYTTMRCYRKSHLTSLARPPNNATHTPSPADCPNSTKTRTPATHASTPPAAGPTTAHSNDAAGRAIHRTPARNARATARGQNPLAGRRASRKHKGTVPTDAHAPDKLPSPVDTTTARNANSHSEDPSIPTTYPSSAHFVDDKSSSSSHNSDGDGRSTTPSSEPSDAGSEQWTMPRTSLTLPPLPSGSRHIQLPAQQSANSRRHQAARKALLNRVSGFGEFAELLYILRPVIYAAAMAYWAQPAGRTESQI